MEFSDWVLGGLLGAAVAWLNYTNLRVRKLEDENKKRGEQIEWLHKRCEKLEASAARSDWVRTEV